jgi:hypothetical protein
MQRIRRLAANQRYPSCRKLSWLPRAIGGSKEGRFLDDAGYDFAPNRRAGAPPGKRYLGHRNLQSTVTLHGISAGSVREVLEGLKPGDPYPRATLRYHPVAPSPWIFHVRKAMRSQYRSLAHYSIGGSFVAGRSSVSSLKRSINIGGHKRSISLLRCVLA